MIENQIAQDPYYAGRPAQTEKPTTSAIILLGPPGTGKGTQARHVAEKFGLPHISTGDVFRSHVARKTRLGMEAGEAMRRGMLLADNVVCGMLSEHIRSSDFAGCFILDGFPRSVRQAEWLDAFLVKRRTASGERERELSDPLAIQINVSRNQLLHRLSGRRSCPTCGHNYNLHFQPPKNRDICDQDGANLVMRPDDSEAVVYERLLVYDKETSPLTEFYRRKGLLWEIDGNGTEDSVWGGITRITRMLTT